MRWKSVCTTRMSVNFLVLWKSKSALKSPFLRWHGAVFKVTWSTVVFQMLFSSVFFFNEIMGKISFFRFSKGSPLWKKITPKGTPFTLEILIFRSKGGTIWRNFFSKVVPYAFFKKWKILDEFFFRKLIFLDFLVVFLKNFITFRFLFVSFSIF